MPFSFFRPGTNTPESIEISSSLFNALPLDNGSTGGPQDDPIEENPLIFGLFSRLELISLTIGSGLILIGLSGAAYAHGKLQEAKIDAIPQPIGDDTEANEQKGDPLLDKKDPILRSYNPEAAILSSSKVALWKSLRTLGLGAAVTGGLVIAGTEIVTRTNLIK